MIRRLLLFLVCFGLLCECASAAITYSASTGTLITAGTTAVYDLPTLYTYYVSVYGETTTRTTLINETSPKHWWVGKTIAVTNPIGFYINSSTATDVKITYRSTDGMALAGYVQVEDCYFESYYNNTLTVPGAGYNGATFKFYIPGHDVYFVGANLVYFGYTGYPIHDNEIYNVTLDRYKTGLSFKEIDNCVIKNIYIEGGGTTTGNGLTGCTVDNSTIYNVSVYNASAKSAAASGCYGLDLSGDNNIIHDYYINEVAWSGTNLHGINLTAYNFTVINSGHNGFEAQTNYSYYENITVINSSAFNYLVSGQGEANVTRGWDIFENIKSFSPWGAGFYTAEGCTDIYIGNSTFSGKGIMFHDTKNTTCINITNLNLNGDQGYRTSIVYPDDLRWPHWYENHTLIDSVFNNTGYTDIYEVWGNPLTVINTKYNTLLIENSQLFYNSYYLDVVTKNSTGGLVTDASIDVSNIVTPNDGIVNGFGANSSTFQSNNGRTFLPTENRILAPVVSDTRGISKFALVNQIYNITSSAGEGSVTLGNLNPSPLWYRSNPANSKYTITAIINDSANTHITGFAPSVDENEFTVGDTVTYQVWPSEDVDSISWKKNGVEVNNDSLTYTDTFTSDPVIVSFSATDANGNISQTWDYNPEALPVAEFTSNKTSGTVPLTVQFTDQSQNALSWYWDFDNDGTVDNSTQNPIYTYDTAGTYTVNLTVQNGEYADSEIKELYIDVNTPSVITTVWNNFWVWWGMRWQVSYWLEAI